MTESVSDNIPEPAPVPSTSSESPPSADHPEPCSNQAQPGETCTQPPPDSSKHGGSSHPLHGNPRRRRAPHLPSREEVLSTIAALVPAMALGTISARDAAAMRACLDSYLRHVTESPLPHGSSSAAKLDALRDVARSQPSIVNLIAPLLSDEELAGLLHEPLEAHGQNDPGNAETT